MKPEVHYLIQKIPKDRHLPIPSPPQTFEDTKIKDTYYVMEPG
jgi:hypothetical protein